MLSVAVEIAVYQQIVVRMLVKPLPVHDACVQIFVGLKGAITVAEADCHMNVAGGDDVRVAVTVEVRNSDVANHPVDLIGGSCIEAVFRFTRADEKTMKGSADDIGEVVTVDVGHQPDRTKSQ